MEGGRGGEREREIVRQSEGGKCIGVIAVSQEYIVLQRR